MCLDVWCGDVCGGKVWTLACESQFCVSEVGCESRYVERVCRRCGIRDVYVYDVCLGGI